MRSGGSTRVKLPRSLSVTNSDPRTSAWVEENFVVGRLIGAGSFGHVYKVEARKRPGTMLALKQLARGVKPRAVALELRVLSRLGGRNNIPRMLAAHRDLDRVFIVMDYVKHCSIQDVIRRMSRAEILDYMRNLFVALRYLHSEGVVHRDVKPGNFLYNPKTKKYALIDFGLSAELEGAYEKENFPPTSRSSLGPSPRTARVQPRLCDCTLQKSVCDTCRNAPAEKWFNGGTSGFRSPELLLRLQDCGTAMDIWAAGVTLLSLLLRRFPVMRPADDCEGLLHIGALVGTIPLKRFASDRGCALLIEPDRPGVDLWKLIEAFDDSSKITGVDCRICKSLIHDNTQRLCLCRHAGDDHRFSTPSSSTLSTPPSTTKSKATTSPSRRLDTDTRQLIRILNQCLVVDDRRRPSAAAILASFDS